MTQFSPASLRVLREDLPPLVDGAPTSPGMREFCHFYGIDFERHMPPVQHCIGTVKSGEFSLAVHCYLQADAQTNLLLVHGYLDHSGLFGHLIEYGLQRGCNVIAFDLPGHGLSTGEQAAIDDFSDYSRAIVDILAQSVVPELPCWVMAQSTGCAALIDYAGKYPWNFTGAVFLAPLIRPASWAKVWLGHTLLHRFRDSIAREFKSNSGDKQFLAFVRHDPLQARYIPLRWIGALRRWLSELDYRDMGVGPLLVVQGEADGTVDWRYNMKHIAQLFPGCQIEYLPTAGHHLANEALDLRQLYLGKVGAFLAALPGQSAGQD